MKPLFYLSLLFLFFSCNEAQTETHPKNDFKLIISDNINKSLISNKQIITVLTNFLKTKNEYIYKNDYWIAADFPRFYHPYGDIFKIEKKGTIDNFYHPTLLEIIETEQDNERLLKIAFIGDDSLKIIYSLIAVKSEDYWIFKNTLDYNTKNWKKHTFKNVNYYISPSKEINMNEVNKQLEFNKSLSSFFDVKLDSIYYYSCVNPVELFNIKGIDYTTAMYFGKYGGFAQGDNIVFSGNNSEFYPHEIAHLYSNSSFRYAPLILKEGVATLLGGQGRHEYKWHREELNKFIRKKPDYNFLDCLLPFERKFLDNNETSIPYMTGALIVELLLKKYNVSELEYLFEKEKQIWHILSKINITKDNFNESLKRQLNINFATDY